MHATPYTFPLLQTHLYRSRSCKRISVAMTLPQPEARSSAPLLRTLHPSHPHPSPLVFLEPTSLLSLPPLLFLSHRHSHLSPTHLSTLTLPNSGPPRHDRVPHPPALFKHVASTSRRPSIAVPAVTQPATAAPAASTHPPLLYLLPPSLPSPYPPPSLPLPYFLYRRPASRRCSVPHPTPTPTTPMTPSSSPIVYLRLGTRFDLAPHPGSDFVRVVSGSTLLSPDRLV